MPSPSINLRVIHIYGDTYVALPQEQVEFLYTQLYELGKLSPEFGRVLKRMFVVHEKDVVSVPPDVYQNLLGMVYVAPKKDDHKGFKQHIVHAIETSANAASGLVARRGAGAPGGRVLHFPVATFSPVLHLALILAFVVAPPATYEIIESWNHGDTFPTMSGIFINNVLFSQCHLVGETHGIYNAYRVSRAHYKLMEEVGSEKLNDLFIKNNILPVKEMLRKKDPRFYDFLFNPDKETGLDEQEKLQIKQLQHVTSSQHLNPWAEIRDYTYTAQTNDCKRDPFCRLSALTAHKTSSLDLVISAFSDFYSSMIASGISLSWEIIVENVLSVFSIFGMGHLRGVGEYLQLIPNFLNGATTDEERRLHAAVSCVCIMVGVFRINLYRLSFPLRGMSSYSTNSVNFVQLVSTWYLFASVSSRFLLAGLNDRTVRPEEVMALMCVQTAHMGTLIYLHGNRNDSDWNVYFFKRYIEMVVFVSSFAATRPPRRVIAGMLYLGGSMLFWVKSWCRENGYRAVENVPSVTVGLENTAETKTIQNGYDSGDEFDVEEFLIKRGT